MRRILTQDHQSSTWPYDDPVTGERDRHKNSPKTSWEGAQGQQGPARVEFHGKARHRPSAINIEEKRGKQT